MADIPIYGRVECVDGPCGRINDVLISYAARQVTHFVVREKGLHHTERLVPVDQVLETTSDLITLRCTKDELAAMEPFIETQYVQIEHLLCQDYPSSGQTFTCQNIEEWVSVEHERIPPGVLAVRRGAQVQATDGRAGRLEEFVVEPASGRITQLVVREGRVWQQKDVSISASQISRIAEKVVYLKLDRHAVQSLPAVPVNRRWRGPWRTKNPTSAD